MPNICRAAFVDTSPSALRSAVKLFANLCGFASLRQASGIPPFLSAASTRPATLVKLLLLFIVIPPLLPQLVVAQTGYPMIMSLKPTAAQVGTASEIEFHTRYSMFGAYQVLVSGDGVSGEVLHPEKKEGETPSLTKMKVLFTVDTSAMPGVRDVKIATPQGISTVGQLVIVQDPVVYETAKNNTRDEAAELPVPATACGVIEANEDVDFFKFSVEAGTELNFHVRCARLQDRIHDMQRHADPMITIRNSMGGTVAASDNSFFGDPFLSVKFDRAGEYFLEIRDVRYHGNTYWEYSVEVTNRPFISNVFPMGISIGQETSVELVGTSLPDNKQIKVTLPADTPAGPAWKRLTLNDAVTNPVAAFATTLPLTLESDATNTTPEGAQQVAIPAGINGRISEDSDVDCFRFTAKKARSSHSKSAPGVISHHSTLTCESSILKANNFPRTTTCEISNAHSRTHASKTGPLPPTVSTPSKSETCTCEAAPASSTSSKPPKPNHTSDSTPTRTRRCSLPAPTALSTCRSNGRTDSRETYSFTSKDCPTASKPFAEKSSRTKVETDASSCEPLPTPGCRSATSASSARHRGNLPTMPNR